MGPLVHAQAAQDAQTLPGLLFWGMQPLEGSRSRRTEKNIGNGVAGDALEEGGDVEHLPPEVHRENRKIGHAVLHLLLQSSGCTSS